LSGLGRSQLTGKPLEPDKPVTVECLFETGERREAKITAAEADALLEHGVNITVWRDRAWRAMRRSVKPLGKWLAVVLIGGFLGAQISDHYADRQRELELEASLITQISGGAIKLFQDAQEASRATANPRQREQREKAADAWALLAGSITPVFRAYFAAEDVSAHWDDYQSAMYDWAALGCCQDEARRAELVAGIRNYVSELSEHIGPPTRKPPVADPWSALERADPPPEVYQWLGFTLLRGRGRILDELKAASAALD
jgi:hypothetical protein